MNKNHDPKTGRFTFADGSRAVHEKSVHLVRGQMHTGSEINAMAERHGGISKIPDYGGHHSGPKASPAAAIRNTKPPRQAGAIASRAPVQHEPARQSSNDGSKPLAAHEQHPARKIAEGHGDMGRQNIEREGRRGASGLRGRNAAPFTGPYPKVTVPVKREVKQGTIHEGRPGASGLRPRETPLVGVGAGGSLTEHQIKKVQAVSREKDRQASMAAQASMAKAHNADLVRRSEKGWESVPTRAPDTSRVDEGWRGAQQGTAPSIIRHLDSGKPMQSSADKPKKLTMAEVRRQMRADYDRDMQAGYAKLTAEQQAANTGAEARRAARREQVMHGDATHAFVKKLDADYRTGAEKSQATGHLSYNPKPAADPKVEAVRKKNEHVFAALDSANKAGKTGSAREVHVANYLHARGQPVPRHTTGQTRRR